MKIKYLILFFCSLFIVACNQKNYSNEAIDYIELRNYRDINRISPHLLLSSYPTGIDTSYYWVFNVIVPNDVLQQVKQKSIVFNDALNITDTSFQNNFYIDVHYAKTNRLESIKIPADKWDNYFDLLIEIVDKNKIKDLAIVKKKLIYMKD
ncbi:MAG: hypothetical protein V4538_13960 [Bacteroidota bacterium]